ncbi:MAG TPA: response regulator transcription factor [Candidatus Dormibacteraeota bacterium]|nr:response regulator transcription factor [Candidatus Dormibacteraeota bacterium]
MIRVLLAEDQQMFRTAIRRLLETEGDIAVVAEVARGDEVIEAALTSRPDVALLDIEMPGLDGLNAAAQLQASLPTCRSLIVTTFGRPGFLQRALASGASGFVLKDAPADALASAIRRCAAGDKVIDSGLAAAAMKLGPSPLTGREREVLVATTGGASIEEIAQALHLSEGSVRNRISSAISKLDARNRADAVRIAGENGWL